MRECEEYFALDMIFSQKCTQFSQKTLLSLTHWHCRPIPSVRYRTAVTRAHRPGPINILIVEREVPPVPARAAWERISRFASSALSFQTMELAFVLRFGLGPPYPDSQKKFSLQIRFQPKNLVIGG